MHTHLVFILSFHTLIALVHPLHGNPYSLTLISIDGHLHSPLIRLVDVILSSPFCLLHNHHSIPPIVLCPCLFLIILHLFHLHRISFTILQSLLSNLYTKIPKIFTLLSLLDLTFVSDCEGLDNPFITLVARFLIVCAGTR